MQNGHSSHVIFVLWSRAFSRHTRSVGCMEQSHSVNSDPLHQLYVCSEFPTL